MSNAQESLQEENLKTIYLSNSIKLGKIMNTDIQDYFENISERVGISFEFLLPPLLTTTSFLMRNSKVIVNEDHSEACVMYAALVANPSTGKSIGLNLFRNAVIKIEKYYGINDEDSKLANGATIEALCFLLKEHGGVLSLFDEASAFLGSFGLYKSGGGNYDRGIYLELFNAFSSFRRDLRSGRTVVKNPRLNICMLAQPNAFIKLLKDEQAVRDDGLMQRFLSCCPKPRFSSYQEIEDAQKIQKLYCLESLMFVVHILHEKEEISYSFAGDAFILYSDIYTEYRTVSNLMNNFDVFISAMYGKAITQLIRISSIVQAIENAEKIIRKLTLEKINVLTIDQELEERVQKLKNDPTYRIIHIDSVSTAKQIVEYFILNRLVMAGYSVDDFELDNTMILEQLITKIAERKQNKENFSNEKLIKEILLMPKILIECKEINQKKKIESSIIKKAFKQMETLNFGTYQEEKGAKGPPKITFKKVTEEKIRGDFTIITNLEAYDVKLDDFVKTLKESGDKSACSSQVTPNLTKNISNLNETVNSLSDISNLNTSTPKSTRKGNKNAKSKRARVSS